MSTAAPELPGRPEHLARPRWHRIYFWLAAFDVLTVTLGLVLTHRIMSIYRGSVDLNQDWADLLRQSSELGRHAMNVNEPGNEVFKTGKYENARNAMEDARTRFDRRRKELDGKVPQVASGEDLRFLQAKVATVTQAMEKMTERAEAILEHLPKGRTKEAQEAMAEMDAENGRIIGALMDFQIQVGDIQKKHFAEHTEAAARYQRFEYVIGLSIFLMVCAATFYGHKLARQAAAHTQALRESELHLEQRVRERTAELERAIAALREGEEQYRRLAKQVITAQEDERRRIARDLHDEIGQSLTYFLIGLRTVEEAPSAEAARARLGELRQVATQTLDEVRRLARGLRPSVLDDLGLGPALERCAEEYAQAHGVPVRVHVQALTERLPEEVETTLYRIVQEALTNIARHAQARQVRISAGYTSGAVEVVVADDGRGFRSSDILTGPTAWPHLGLSGMCERARLLNGTVQIDSRPGTGTTVRVTLPLTEMNHGEDSRPPGG